MAAKVQQRVLVDVKPDHLQAWVQPAPKADLTKLTADEIVTALEAADVVADEVVATRINEYLESQKGKPSNEPVLITEGKPPVEAQDGTFVWDENIKESDNSPNDDDAQIDYRRAHMIRTVEKDTAIGKVLPPQPGQPGVDVHGNSLEPPSRIPQPVKLLNNVRLLEDDHQTVIASEAGRVVFKDGELYVREVLEIKGDVDFDSGNIDVTSDVSITGNVCDLFEVASKKTISVNSSIEAAKIIAGEDVIVRGGILSRHKGSVTAQGKIMAKFCSEANIHACEAIYIGKEIINSQVHTNDTLHAERAAIIGGEVYGRSGIEAGTLGSDAGVETKIAVGTPSSVFQKVQQLDDELKKQQKMVEKIRTMVQPLMANLKRLTASQKEKATELLYQADDLEAGIKAKQQLQEQLFDTSPVSYTHLRAHET